MRRIAAIRPKRAASYLVVVLLCWTMVGAAVKSIRALPLDAPEKQKEKPQAREVTVVPKINILSKDFWADGVTPVLINISLETTNGSEGLPYKAKEEMVFRLGPASASFVPPSIKIPAGQSVSNETSLIAKTPGPLEITCTPERQYNGITIGHAPPAKINFTIPIHGIGIEPVGVECPINITRPFRVFLYNRSNPHAEVQPASDVSIQLESENGNGNISKSQVTLTSTALTQVVRYKGTRIGSDAIVAEGSYGGVPIRGKSERQILFPWVTFVLGIVGAIIGSVVRMIVGEVARRKTNFIESLVFGVAFCLIVIFAPAILKLDIENQIQPLLLLALATLISGFGPELLKQILFRQPQGAAR